MGLPQIPSSETAGNVSTLTAVLHSSPQFCNASLSAMNSVQSGSTSGLAVYPLRSSFGDFSKKASLETSTVSDNIFNYTGAMEVTSNVHCLNIGSTDKSCGFASKNGRNIHIPASRVVGFGSGRTSSLSDGLVSVSATNLHTSASSDVSTNDTEPVNSLARKRLLSPLSSMLSPVRFNGDPLDIGCKNIDTCSNFRNDSGRNFAQDYKKPNIGSKNSCTMSSWSFTSCLEPKNLPNSAEPIFLTDGPLLENGGIVFHSSRSSTAEIDHFRESSQLRFQSGAISISPNNVNSPHSFSPLGPKFSERLKTARGRGHGVKDINNCDITLRSIEQSLDKSNSCLTLNYIKDESGVASKCFEDVGFLCKDFGPSSLDDTADIGWPLSQELSPMSHSLRFSRSLSGLPVRRSLVGSFEESLLSGRFLSGNLSKVCIVLLSEGDVVHDSECKTEKYERFWTSELIAAILIFVEN